MGGLLNFLLTPKRVHSYIVLSGPIFVLFLGFLLKFSFFNLFLLLLINLYLSFRFQSSTTKNKDLFQPLNVIALAFIALYLIQSPIFPGSLIFIEVFYFSVKLISICLIVGLIIKKRTEVACLFTLLFHFIDILSLRFVNLDLIKTPTEYIAIFELLACLYCYIYLSLFFIRKKPSIKKTINSSLLISLCIFTLANYWTAGQAKLLLDGGPLSFIQNETFLTASRASFWGLNVLDLSLMDENIYAFLQSLGNYIVLFTQSTVAIITLFPGLILIYTLFFELFHVIVGLTAGVWFYKWMWVTSVIIFYRKKIRTAFQYRTSRTNRLILLGVLLISPIFLNTEPLAWYEIRQGDIVKAYGHLKEEKVQLHPQYFGSASFPILKKQTHYVFNYGAQFHFHAAETYGEKLKAIDCSYTKVQNPTFKESVKLRVEEISYRLLEDRSLLSKFLIHLQPYHILIPNPQIDSSILGTQYEKIRFETTSVCFDKFGKIENFIFLDEFTVTSSGLSRDLIKPYKAWFEEKISRMSDKNIVKRYLSSILEKLDEN